MSQRQRIAVIALAVVVLVVGFVVANGSKNDNNGSSSGSVAATATTTAASGGTTAAATSTAAAPAPATPVITITGGKPAGGIKKLTFAKGDDVRFTVASDVADEIHVHGYDFHKDVAKGGKVSFDFPAKIDGIFEIELENAGVQIAELKVTP